MIEATNIYKSYRTLEVLKGIDLKVQDSEIISITGPSGAGKTTLLQILGTLDQADKGTVQIDNINVNQLKSKKLSDFRNQSIGFIFQFHHLLPEFDALENVAIPAFIAGQSRTEGENAAKELLAYLGMSDRLHHKPSELSGGEQQRVAVARALVNHPKVVLADEPSGNLDSQTAEELHQLFFQLRKELSQTFVIVTHNNELAAMADRRIHLVDGQIQDKETLKAEST